MLKHIDFITSTPLYDHPSYLPKVPLIDTKYSLGYNQEKSAKRETNLLKDANAVTFVVCAITSTSMIRILVTVLVLSPPDPPKDEPCASPLEQRVWKLMELTTCP